MVETAFVDLSAKVEQWNKNTAVAFSDGINGTILISKKTKKTARNWLKIQYPNRSASFYRYSLLSALIYLLLKPNLQEIRLIVVDKDYPGEESENQIRSRLLQFFHREGFHLRGIIISFQEVKGSKADILARSVFVGERDTDREVSLNEIKAVFTKR